MSDPTDTAIGFLLLAMIAALLAIPFAAVWTLKTSCESKWQESHMEARWEFFAGCRVRLPDGRWVPTENVRDIDIHAKETK